MTGSAKPSGLSPEFAAQFEDPSIVRAYPRRSPYPPETFEVLANLAGVAQPAILDLGCGTGDLTVGLSAFASTVDAVDSSAEMIAAARVRPTPRCNVRRLEAAAETVPVAGPYDLVTAGESLHWMDWEAVLALIRRVLAGRFLAIVERDYARRAWWDAAFQAIIDRHSTNKAYQPYDLVAELTRRGLWSVAGECTTAPIPFRQTVDELIEAFHSRNGFSRDRMAADEARQFDDEAAGHLTRFAEDGFVDLGAIGRVVWGTVCPRS
jgi:SAM-dependent methyltransferase